MLIEVSGMQRTGKSTLIEGLTMQFNLYKFPMGTVCKTFNIKPTWEMQIAKDISTMEVFDQVISYSEVDDVPTITDRGPLSTIFYSLLFKRATDEQIEAFVEYLSNYSFWHPIWVEAINQPVMTREKSDGFDKLQADLDVNEVKLTKQKMFDMLSRHNVMYTLHTNDFSRDIPQNQSDFMSKVLRVYDMYREKCCCCDLENLIDFPCISDDSTINNCEGDTDEH